MAEHTLSFNLRANTKVKEDWDTCKKAIEKDLGIQVTNAQTLGMVLKFYKQRVVTGPSEMLKQINEHVKEIKENEIKE